MAFTSYYYPTYYTAYLGTYTNPTYAYADDTNYAVSPTPASGTVGIDYGFDAISTTDIPDGNIIYSYNFEWCWKNNLANIGHIYYYFDQLAIGGAVASDWLSGNGAYTTDQISTTGIINPTTGGDALPTLTDLRTADNFRLRNRLTYLSVGDTNIQLDYVKIRFEYGATYVKTAQGLAKASVKTKQGLANASIKTWQGLT